MSELWYKDWFDSPYYHILYKNRDTKEAKKFIKNLIDKLKPDNNAWFLDAACGKGRYSIYLSSLGFKVDAFDLSENSINDAKRFENEKLKFYINDIRVPLKENYYDYVFNLFTSFGYFDDENNQKAIEALGSSLKTGTTIVIDYLNANQVINNLVEREIKEVDGITFSISRRLVDGFITKQISFNDKNYQEQVKAIYLNDFEKMLKKANLDIEKVFGDYDLSNFDPINSKRLIIIARKNA